MKKVTETKNTMCEHCPIAVMTLQIGSIRLIS